MKSKQRSFEDFIGTSFVLIDADLLLICMNNFQICFCFHLASCVMRGLACHANNFVRGVYCMLSKIMIMFQINIYIYVKYKCLDRVTTMPQEDFLMGLVVKNY